MKYLRRILLTLGMILALFLATPFSSPQRARGVLRFNVEMQAYDGLTVYIEPAVDGLTALCDPLEANRPFALYVASNTSIPLSPKPISRSLVQLSPESESYYNITLSFESPRPWQIRIGVVTDDPKAYTGFVAVEPKGSRYFVELVSGVNEAPGSYVVNIFAHARGIRSSSPFGVQVPSAFNSVFVLLVALSLAYVNIFAVVDAYFRTKSEGISRQRRIGVALMIVGSIILVYWVYVTTGAAQPREVGGIVG